MTSPTRRDPELEPLAEPAAASPTPAPSPLVASSADLRALAGADARSRGAMVARLQQASGNAAIARMLQPTSPSLRTETRVERYAFRASIKRTPTPSVAEPGAAPAGRADAGPGQEHGAELAGVFAALGAGGPEAAAAAPQPAAGAPAPAAADAPAAAGPDAAPAPAEPAAAAPAADAAPAAPISVPDIEVPMLATVGKSDSVAGTFSYTGSIARGGDQPSGFGVTRSFGSKLTGVTITPKTGSFEVTATLEHPITYQVRSGTGPDGQKDIPNETDGKITKATYPTVASDLTPNMSDLNGRPPRTKFWAEDLTLKHELVHANDDKGNGPAAMDTAKTWLNTQTASSAGDVTTHLGKIPGRFAQALLAALSTEDGEKHAYGDGAPSYKARADSIKAKGDKGDYK